MPFPGWWASIQARPPRHIVFCRVRQQVEDRLRGPLEIHADARLRRLGAVLEPDAMGGHQRLGRRNAFVDQSAAVGFGHAELDSPRIVPAQIQHLVDKRQQLLSCRVDRVGVAPLQFVQRVLLVDGQKLGKAQDCVQRRAELVADAG